ELVDDVLADLKLASDEAGAIITREDLPIILADKVQCTQVFQNLISNAIKYRREMPPTVRISARLDNDEWTFTVSDNGLGIASRYHERIFEIFKRLHGVDEYPGTGIGLAICKKIVDRHGGRIWVESQPGKGSDFVFTLPVRTDYQEGELSADVAHSLN